MERDAESVRHLDLPMSGTRDAAGGVESASSRSNRKKATNMFIPAGARHATVITIEAQDRGRAGATTCYIAPFPVWKRGRNIRLRLLYVRSFERYWTEWLSSVPHEENKVIREKWTRSFWSETNVWKMLHISTFKPRFCHANLTFFITLKWMFSCSLHARVGTTGRQQRLGGCEPTYEGDVRGGWRRGVSQEEEEDEERHKNVHP